MIIIDQNKNLLTEIQSLLKNLDLSTFLKKRSFIHNSTLGQHCRHIIEFYLCILQQYSTGSISYDSRKRDKRLENSIDFTLETVTSIKAALSLLTGDENIKVIASYGELDIEQELFQSSLKRELAYAMDHAIHHLAIVKIMLSLDGLKVPDHLGVAPSSMRFENKKLN